MVRIALSWLCYWLGDLVSRPMDRWNIYRHLYPIYDKLMCWAYVLQGDDPRGPWQPAKKGSRDAD